MCVVCHKYLYMYLNGIPIDCVSPLCRRVGVKLCDAKIVKEDDNGQLVNINHLHLFSFSSVTLIHGSRDTG